jgi:uncharacterized RDD family membrane protein YckC
MSQEDGQLVRSPEQVTLFLPVAGPTTRMLAYAIDAVVMWTVVAAIWIGLLFGVPVVARVIPPSFFRWLQEQIGAPVSAWLIVLVAMVVVAQFVVELGYFVFVEWVTGGQSIGKRRLRLRVVRDGGFPIGIRESFVRNLLRAVDSLPWSYVVGIVTILVTSEGKRLGDLAAGTLVVRLDRPLRPAALPEVPPEARTAFTFDRAQIARIGPTEVSLAIETLRRLETLDADRAEEALARAAAALVTRMGREPVEPHERAAFLRAVLDAVGV